MIVQVPKSRFTFNLNSVRFLTQQQKHHHLSSIHHHHQKSGQQHSATISSSCCFIGGGGCFQQKRWMGHSIRLIALEDLPHGKAYKGDVVTVKAGYARNYLIPQKYALYATPQNFDKLNMIDPDHETEEQRLSRLQRESNITAAEDKQLKDADLLKKYLKSKVLQIWRSVDPNSTDTLHPGSVTSENLRQKLSKQLKIDLDEGSETIHIFRDDAAAADTTTTTTTNPINFTELDDGRIQTMVDEYIPSTDECTIKINRLGDYLAVIGLNGGYNVPLRFVVRQRGA